MKKLAILLAIFGVLLAAGGTAMMVLEPKEENTNVNNNSSENKYDDSMTCSYSITEESTQIKTEMMETYNFDDNGLISYTSATTMTATTDEQKEEISSYAAIFSLLKVDEEGFKSFDQLSSDGLSYSYTVSVDFNKFDPEVYNAKEGNTTLTLNHKKGESKEEIKQLNARNGATCK